MSEPIQPVPVTVVPDERPVEVVIISHSPLFYWWPVWAVGFLMAALSYWRGYQVAFVPPGTTVEREVQVRGQEGPRDILIVPEGQALPAASDPDQLAQPRLRMAVSNDPGVVWAMTLLLVIVVTHVKLRGAWSLVAIILLGSTTVLFGVLGLWDPILRGLRFIDIHINAFGYLSISLFLFVLWLIMFLVFDRLTYMIFTRGRLRVRKAIGEGEKVFDMRGMVFQRHRDDMFRHWLLGFGTADLTVFTSGANAQQIEMPNVFGIGRKLALINKMLQELEVTKGR
ncbi:MAG TPA: hypothetical protein VKD72_16320 [Gemmataceae bacterium]|nr:hypothetical protein [Gemmataceae bacterium]